LPWVHGYYGKFYVVIVIATVIPLILYAAFAIITKPEVRIFDRASGALRYAMLAGLAAILLGRF
jgi:hypothetical protein